MSKLPRLISQNVRRSVRTLLLASLGIVLGWIVVWGPGGYLSSLIHTHLHLPTLDINTITGMSVIEATRLLPRLVSLGT